MTCPPDCSAHCVMSCMCASAQAATHPAACRREGRWSCAVGGWWPPRCTGRVRTGRWVGHTTAVVCSWALGIKAAPATRHTATQQTDPQRQLLHRVDTPAHLRPPLARLPRLSITFCAWNASSPGGKEHGSPCWWSTACHPGAHTGGYSSSSLPCTGRHLMRCGMN